MARIRAASASTYSRPIELGVEDVDLGVMLDRLGSSTGLRFVWLGECTRTLRTFGARRSVDGAALLEQILDALDLVIREAPGGDVSVLPRESCEPDDDAARFSVHPLLAAWDVQPFDRILAIDGMRPADTSVDALLAQLLQADLVRVELGRARGGVVVVSMPAEVWVTLLGR